MRNKFTNAKIAVRSGEGEIINIFLTLLKVILFNIYL